MTDRLVSALVALSMAFLVWLYMRSRDQETLDDILVPVHVSLGANQVEQYDLELSGPGQIPVSFTGSPSRLRELRGLLQRGELRVELNVTVPDDRMELSRYTDSISIGASDIHPPPGVTPMVIQGRNRIAVTLHRLVDRRLPVRFEQTALEKPSSVTLEPASVLVRGPQELLERLRNIPTVPYTVPPQAAANQVWAANNVPLVQEIDGRRIRTTPRAVNAQITIQPQQVTLEVNDIPVQFLCPANFPMRASFTDERAGKISVRLMGPAGNEPPAVNAFIDLGGRKWEPGLYEEPVKLQLPKDFQLAQKPPRPVAFQLVPLESPQKTSESALSR